VDENAISAIGASGAPLMSATIGSLSYVLWMLGYPDQVLREVARMTSLLSGPVNLFERAGIIQSLLWTRCHFLRDYHGMRPQAEVLLALARENGFTLFLGAGLVRFGRILVEEKNFAEGIETMLEGMRVVDSVGANLFHATYSCVLTDAYLAASQPSEGLAAVEQAIDHAEQDQIRLCGRRWRERFTRL
jgi:hypothetical protein